MNDWIEALIAYWASVSYVAPVSPALYFAKAHPGPVWTGGQNPDTGGYYPVATFMQIAGKSSGLNTGPGFWSDNYYQFSFDHPSMDVAIANGKLAKLALGPLLRQPLVFGDGYQMTCYQTGNMLGEILGTGPAANAYVWRQSLVYIVSIGETRATYGP